MQTIWFCLIAIMIAMYVVLDGFDLGAGAIHLWVARDDGERQQVIRSIGPVWDGNEVWLLAAGGTLYFAFPAALRLQLQRVLLALDDRSVAADLARHCGGVPRALDRRRLAAGFGTWSLPVPACCWRSFFGAALGNVVRGVPLNDQGYFFEALWTNFRLGPNTGMLDWYTIIVGVAALATLVLHGALWVALKTESAVHDRSHRLARGIWWIVLLLTIVLTVITFKVQPEVPANLIAHPWGYVFPALALFGLAGMAWFMRKHDDLKELPGILRLHRRHVDQRRLRIVSTGSSRQHQSRVLAHRR